MIRQKIKLAWKALPSGIKRAFGLAAGFSGFLLELAVDDKSSASQGVVYNHRTDNYDDGHDLIGIYSDDFPVDDPRHYDV